MTERVRHIVVVLLAYKKGKIDEFFDYAYSQVEMCEAILNSPAGPNVKVTVLTRYNERGTVVRNGIDYLYVKDSFPPLLPFLGFSRSLTRVLGNLSPDIVHIHGLIFPLQCFHIRRQLPSTCRIFAEYHSDPLRNGLRALIQKKCLADMDGVLFTNRAHAQRWTKRILSPDKVHWSLEASSNLQYQERESARAETEFYGSPIFLWNSRVIPRRDPLTVLKGFALYLKYRPKARFYILAPDWHENLVRELKNTIEQDPSLANSVTMIQGRRPHDQMAVLYNSADYLLSGSTDDAYGFGAADALSCGVIPIVTDIPTFRDITNDGEIGGLWKVGDAVNLCTVIHNTVESTYQEIKQSSQDALKHFEKNLSYSAIADRLLKIYSSLDQDACEKPN